MAGKRGRKPSVVAKGKKKLAHSLKNEPPSPDPCTSDSGGSLLPITIYNGSPDRVEYPRPAKRKRKTSESPANPAKRRDVVKTPHDSDLVDSPAAPRQPSLPSRSQTKAISKVKKMKTPTSQRQLSKGAVKDEAIEISSRVETTESYNDSASAGSPANVQPPCGTTQQPSRPRRSHTKRGLNGSDYATSPAPVPRQPSLPRRGQTKIETQLRKMKIIKPLHELSTSSEERELYDASGAASPDGIESAGSPANNRLLRSSSQENSHLQTQVDDSSLGIEDYEQSGTSQNQSITQETRASSVTQAMSPYSTQHDVPKPRFEWETSNILKMIPVSSTPARLKAVCRSSDGTEQSIWLDDLIDRCPRKVALHFQKVAIKSYEKEMMVV